MKMNAISHVSHFLKEAKQRGIKVLTITCSDGTRWLYKERWHRKLCLAAAGCNVRLNDSQNPEIYEREWAIQETDSDTEDY